MDVLRKKLEEKISQEGETKVCSFIFHLIYFSHQTHFFKKLFFFFFGK